MRIGYPEFVGDYVLGKSQNYSTDAFGGLQSLSNGQGKHAHKDAQLFHSAAS